MKMGTKRPRNKPASIPLSSEIREVHALARATRRKALLALAEEPDLEADSEEALQHLGNVLLSIPSLIDIEERLLRIVQESGAAPIPDTPKKASSR